MKLELTEDLCASIYELFALAANLSSYNRTQRRTLQRLGNKFKQPRTEVEIKQKEFDSIIAVTSWALNRLQELLLDARVQDMWEKLKESQERYEKVKEYLDNYRRKDG